MMRSGSPSLRSERGATATIVVVLMAFVFMGFAAISVDVGRGMIERRELQNGADAGALALAASCAKGACETIADLQGLVDANATDNSHEVTSICGTGVPGDPCPPGSIPEFTECPPIPDTFAGLPFVEVNTSTPSDALINNLFGSAAGASSTRVAACARAAWGQVGRSIPTLPIVFAECDWVKATIDGFAPSPPYDPPPGTSSTLLPQISPGKVTAIYAHLDSSEKPTEDNATKCLASNNPGKFYSGGFGWVQTCEKQGYPSPLCDGVSKSDTCTAVFDATGTILIGDNGASAPKGCKKDELSNYLGTQVWVPIMTKVNVDSQGKATGYVVDGVSAFFLAGYNDIPSAQPKTKAVYGGSPCGKGDCLWGWFTGPVVPTGTIGTGSTPRGPTVVVPAG
ncbi:hypothetical protein GCM10023168_26180 [Fodinibacter luteus]|uniref:Putative Flp pilus-assembly TadG-like N-terminal domain-containing protein n=1 Tax=Fodinibacter luteus TaxID=552064 RepID=A0ABP8KKB4_9MICO